MIFETEKAKVDLPKIVVNLKSYVIYSATLSRSIKKEKICWSVPAQNFWVYSKDKIATLSVCRSKKVTVTSQTMWKWYVLKLHLGIAGESW